MLYCIIGQSNSRLGSRVNAKFSVAVGMPSGDYCHLPRNQTLLAGHFSNFQLLGYCRFSPHPTYPEAHYDHHFNGFFFDRVPLMRRLKWQEVASLNYLTTAQAGHYLELGTGLRVGVGCSPLGLLGGGKGVQGNYAQIPFSVL